MRYSDIKHFLRRMRWYELAAAVMTVLATCAVFVTGALHFFEVCEIGLEICTGLMALIIFAQSVQNWRKNRKPALICLGCGILCTLFSVFVYFAV